MSPNEEEVVPSLEDDKKALLKRIRARLKRIRLNRKKHEKELAECKDWEKVFHHAQLLQGSFHLFKRGSKSVSVNDWESGEEVVIELDPRLKPDENVAMLFKRSKKLKARLPYVEDYLQYIDEEQKRLESLAEEIEKCEAEEALIPIQERCLDILGEKQAPPKEKREEKKKGHSFREYLTESGLSIFVGRGAQENDYLTMSFAKGLDWWFHVSEYAGAHVVLRVPKGSDPDEEALLDAMQVALYYSKGKELGKAEVLMTQRKYVSKPPKSPPGRVNVSKHRNVMIKLDRDRFNEIKKRERK